MASIIEAIKSVIAGRFVRVGSTSQMKIKAAYKNNVSIIKVTERTVRIGLNYANIAAVKAMEAQRIEPKTQRTDNNIWEVEGRVAFNTNTGKKSLRVYTVAHHSNSKSKYIITVDGVVTECDTLPEWAIEYIVPSSLNRSGEMPVCMSLTLDNVYMLGSYGESRFAVKA